MSADRIVDENPYHKLENIHHALSYYSAHKTALDKKYTLACCCIDQPTA